MINRLLTNTTSPSFLEYIKHALQTCEAFYVSVSFIKRAGLTLIEDDIVEALERGVHGKVVTSTYQNFTDIQSLKQLLRWKESYNRFDCHLDHLSFGDRGFHTKGYIFVFNDRYEVAIGSSNVTLYALRKNIEWNVHVSSKTDEGFFQSVIQEFENVWDATEPLKDTLIKSYQEHMEYAIDRWDMDYVHVFKTLEPNYMQRKALKEIRRYRDLGIERALVVAATGSGKTHLAAFDAKHFDAARVLFVVHRENILTAAAHVFRDIMGPKYSIGYLTGQHKDFDADLLFATNLTLSNNLDMFGPKDFDYMILDEVHHAAAQTYQDIINHFEPMFLLGLTATPERTDDSEAIYQLFEDRIPFDLRLRDAILNELIVPFHYYGIRNTMIDYDDKDIRQLIIQMRDPDHIDFIDQEVQKHRPNGKIKAIVFCMNVNHARIMAELMRFKGYHTIDLVGHHSVGERRKAFEDLQDDTHPLEMIMTVDILNEGIDIPAINMVLFLRPTESSIIFLQQLGRGLRKYPNKPYLTVLDFIGNSYRRSVQIARALGTLSRNQVMEKKLLIDMIREDFQSIDIPGVQISIDQLSKEEVIDHIQSTNFNLKRYMISDYQAFKSYIHATPYPKHMDYYQNDFAPDLMRFINARLNGSKNGSYYAFLKKIGEDVPDFNDHQQALLTTLSVMLPLVRPEEYAIVSYLLDVRTASLNDIVDHFKQSYGRYREKHVLSALRYLLKTLPGHITHHHDTYSLHFEREDHVLIEHVQDILTYGLARYDDDFGEFDGDLKMYASYSTEQIMMATCQPDVYVYQKGTKIENDGTVYIFAQLKKDMATNDHLKYKDRFISPSFFQWESETRTPLDGSRAQKLIHAKRVHLFIRKMKEEDGITLPYTYIGEGMMTNPRASDNPQSTILLDIVLEHDLPKYLQYDFMGKVMEHEKDN